MNDIKFQKTPGGLGRQLPGEDHISGMIFYKTGLPSGFDATQRIKQVFSIQDAEALGIVNDKSDETKATGGNVLLTTKGATGNIDSIIINRITLGAYTILTGDADVNAEAVGLRAAINALTSVHGFSAGGSGANVLLSAPAGKGDSINSGLSFYTSGTGAATVTQFSGGVDAFFDVMHYHISEYFRIQPQGNLFIMINDLPAGSIDFTETITLQNFAAGIIRQFMVFTSNKAAFSSADVTTLEAILDGLESNHQPLIAVIGGNFKAVSDLSALSNLRALAASRVSVPIGADGGSVGQSLELDKGFSVGIAGAVLGAISLARIHESIAWVNKFNMSDSIELNVPALPMNLTSNFMKDVSLTIQDTLQSKGYIFLIKHVGADGTYLNESACCVPLNSDYAYIENNRTMDKAMRGVRSKLLPMLNGPVYINAQSGTLAPDSIKYYEELGNQALEQMEKDGELSGFLVYIDPSQNLLSNSTLQIVVKNVPVGVSRNMLIKIGYVTSIQ